MIESTGGSGERPPAALLEVAIGCHQRGDLDAAERLYGQILAADPQQFTVLHLLGVLKNQRGDCASAIQLLSAALKLNPRSAMAHFNLGLALSNHGHPEEAIAKYQDSLLLKPGQPEVLLNCALTLQALERPKEALERWDQLLHALPDHPTALLSRGFALQDLHRAAEAQAGFERALALDPGLAGSLLDRARALRQALRGEEALATIDKVLALHPDQQEALQIRAGVLLDLGRTEAALAIYDRLSDLNPADIGLQIDRGNALMGGKRFAEALACYDRVVAIDPAHPDGLMNRGTALLELHRPLDALACYDQVLVQHPGHADTLLNRGNALLGLGRPQDALDSFDRALAAKPGNPEALLNRANALLALKRPLQAMESCEQALALKPDSADAHINRGTALLDLKRPAEALVSFDTALALKPDSPDLLMNRGTALHLLGRHREAIASYDRALALDPGHSRAHSNKIYLLDFLDEVGFLEHQVERRNYFRAHAAGIKPLALNPDCNPNRRLVLGYVSADFLHHSAASCFLPILERHSREGFQINCYSGVLVEDDWTRRFQACAKVWRRTTAMSDEALANQIREDRVDILIDLSGHSKGNRLLAFARKPAPIQVTAWGHGGGTGLPMIDYQLADPVSIPSHVRPLFAEEVWDLSCSITFESPSFSPPIKELPAYASGSILFGSLNRYTKVTPVVEQLWARILKSLPGSRLMLKDGLFDHPDGRAAVLARFAALGISKERIELRGHTSHEAHLAACSEVDIALDTFPQNGGITTWEALWMGAPVVTMLGNKLAGRLSGGILHSLGLPEWVGQNQEDYVRIALRQASDWDALARFRQSIRARMFASQAGNPEKYTREVEAAYRSMWQRKMDR